MPTPRSLPRCLQPSSALAFKIALKFPKVFWDRDEHFFGVIGASRPESVELLNMARYTEQPILLLEAIQHLAATLESASETEAVSRVMKDISAAFGASVPEPTAVVRNDWGASPFTRGSYSYWAVGSSDKDQRALAVGRARVVHSPANIVLGSIRAPSTERGSQESPRQRR